MDTEFAFVSLFFVGRFHDRNVRAHPRTNDGPKEKDWRWPDCTSDHRPWR